MPEVRLRKIPVLFLAAALMAAAGPAFAGRLQAPLAGWRLTELAFGNPRYVVAREALGSLGQGEPTAIFPRLASYEIPGPTPSISTFSRDLLVLLIAALIIVALWNLTLRKVVAAKTRALKKSEERYRLLFERNPTAIWRSSREGRITDCNEAFLRLLGFETREDLQSASLWDLYPSTEVKEAILGMLLEKGNLTNHEVYLERKDGASLWVLESITLLREEGQPDLLEGAFVDFTARKRVEERLRKLNDCLLSLGYDTEENIRRLTALWGESVGASAAFYNRLEGPTLCSVGHWMAPPGYVTVDDAIGHICYDVIMKGSEEIALVRSLAQTAYASSDPNVRLYGLKTYLGKAVKFSHEYEGSLCAVFQHDYIPSEDDLRMLGIVASAVGVEEELRRVKEALLRAKTLEAIGLVAGGVAHEVRNPLFSLSTLSAALEKKLSGDPQVKPFLDLIQAQVKRLSSLMNDLLDLGKPIDPSLFASCSLHEVLAESVRIAGTGPQGERTTVSLEGDHVPLSVRGIPSKLTQVFANLIQNPKHFSEPGDQVRVIVSSDPMSAVVSVADTGPGIPPEMLSQLFEPFTSRREGGTGLGLAIVRKIVEAHGGSVFAENRPDGPGAVFSVRLPVEKGPAVQEVSSPPLA